LPHDRHRPPRHHHRPTLGPRRRPRLHRLHAPRVPQPLDRLRPQHQRRPIPLLPVRTRRRLRPPMHRTPRARKPPHHRRHHRRLPALQHPHRPPKQPKSLERPPSPQLLLDRPRTLRHHEPPHPHRDVPPPPPPQLRRPRHPVVHTSEGVARGKE